MVLLRSVSKNNPETKVLFFEKEISPVHFPEWLGLRIVKGVPNPWIEIPVPNHIRNSLPEQYHFPHNAYVREKQMPLLALIR